jgi:putative ABC transport system permease protein
MFKNYFKIAIRNLSKSKTYSAINIFGLAIGMAACLLIGIYIFEELSYDKFNVNADRIVRVTMEYKEAGTVNKTPTTGTKPGPEFKRNFPAVEEFVRTFISHSVIQNGDKRFEEPRILYADEPFFKIFSFNLIAGDAATALDAPDKIVMTKSMVQKYFATKKYADVINKTITCNGKTFRISGVCEDAPENSQIKFDFVTQFLNLGNGVKDETWWTANWVTYLLVKDKKSISQLQQQINAFMNRKEIKSEAGIEGNNYLAYHLEPLTKVHLYSPLAAFEPNGSITYIYMFSIIALLILLIACANYTNLATAQSVSRSGEIGVRKVMGASKRQVFFQFLGESSVITFISAALAFSLCLIAIPYFNSLTGKHFTYHVLTAPLPLITLLALTLIVSLVAGLYPALVLSGTQIMGVLKKGFSFTGGNNLLRKSLIVIQFAISVFLIIYTVIILQQMHFMQKKNIGYDKDHVLVLPIAGNMLNDFESLKNAFSLAPGVESVTASYETPEFVEWGDGITAVDEKGKHEISLNAMPVDLDFVKTLGMQMAAGRDFLQSDFGMMDTANNYRNYKQPYIINETLAKKLGWKPKESIGRIITKGISSGPVVGVVKDFNFSSLHDPIGPLLIFLGRGYSRDFMLRINGSDIQNTIASLQAIWKQRIPDRPFTYHFLSDDYNKLYVSEQRTSVLLTTAAILAIILACLGLFGLAAFTTVQRTKEIGIRKVLGANVQSIILLIAKNFLQLTAIAVIIAIPVAWWAGYNWLQDFAFRIQINWLIFLIAAAGVLAIALLTISFQAIRAARANPVNSLRSE